MASIINLFVNTTVRIAPTSPQRLKKFKGIEIDTFTPLENGSFKHGVFTTIKIRMETENKDLEKARDLSMKLLAVLKDENANDVVNDMALTRLLAAIYSLQPTEIADKLIRLHCDNLRCSVREIRENRFNLN